MWKPIETAPRDGTEFLGYYSGSKLMAVGAFYNGVFSDSSDNWSSPPTHWVPLPEPPTE